VSLRNEAEADSFEAFYQVARRPLLGMGYVLTGNPQTAQDVVQETFLRTWSRWGRISKLEDPLAWSRKVLYNLAMSEGRSARVRIRANIPTLAGSSPPPNETHVLLAAALRKLPENQARSIVLHDGAGMSVREIASEMNAPEGTVRSWLTRGRAAAAELLNPNQTSAEESHA
jgi:RNA polymerase sigma-70 factor (ECF subfamily)